MEELRGTRDNSIIEIEKLTQNGHGVTARRPAEFFGCLAPDSRALCASEDAGGLELICYYIAIFLTFRAGDQTLTILQYRRSECRYYWRSPEAECWQRWWRDILRGSRQDSVWRDRCALRDPAKTKPLNNTHRGIPLETDACIDVAYPSFRKIGACWSSELRGDFCTLLIS